MFFVWTKDHTRSDILEHSMWCLPCVFFYDKIFVQYACIEGMFILTEVNMDIDSHLGLLPEFYDFNTDQETELYKVLRILYFNK